MAKEEPLKEVKNTRSSSIGNKQKKEIFNYNNNTESNQTVAGTSSHQRKSSITTGIPPKRS